MFKNITDFLLIGIIMLALDAIYLGVFTDYFRKQIASVQRVALQPRYLGAVICYIALIFGLNHFVISQKKSVFEAFLLGLVIYAVYDSTNYALFKNWKIETLVMDTIWGGILFALTTFFVYKIRGQ